MKEEAICANSPQAPPCTKLWRNIRFDSVGREVVPSFPSVLLHYWQINQEEAGGVGGRCSVINEHTPHDFSGETATDIKVSLSL
jgi:hypothetical protein